MNSTSAPGSDPKSAESQPPQASVEHKASKDAKPAEDQSETSKSKFNEQYVSHRSANNIVNDSP